MPCQGLPDGLYLVKQSSAGKGVDHFGILDIGNLLGVPGADGINPVVVHQTPPRIRHDWFQNTGSWLALGRITDEPFAIARHRMALANPAYDLFGNNCEHFARFIATGVRESKQLQAAGWAVGLTALVLTAPDEAPPRRRRRAKRPATRRAA
jgi:hypothetical protein